MRAVRKTLPPGSVIGRLGLTGGESQPIPLTVLAQQVAQIIGVKGLAPTTGALVIANNLADVASASSSRTNLGLGNLAQLSSPLPVANGGTGATAAGATAANNIGALAEANNLSDVASASTSRTNLGLSTMATQAASAVAITGGTIDGTAIGGVTPAGVSATTVAASGQITGSSTGTACYSANGALNGATAVAGYQVTTTFGSGVTAAARCFDSAPSTAAAAFTTTNFNHFHARALSLGAGSAVTIQNGFVAGAGLGGIAGTINAGFRGLLASGATNWNLYCDGTAANYLAGILQTGGARADTSYSYQTPATGFSITIGNNIYTLILDPAGALLTGTITMPATPVDGQVVRITSTQSISTLTVSPNTGQSIKNAPTSFTVSLTGDQGYEFIYRLANTTWYRLQ